MKQKTFRLFSSMLMTLVLMLSMAVTAYAKDSSVTYEGGAEKYVFLPGSSYSGTDLFDNFKGVMPGDKLTQKVTVKNESRSSDKVNIYMRAETHVEDESYISDDTEAAIRDYVNMADFLHQLSMTVKNGDTVIYNAPADQLDGLKNNVLLGTFYPGQETELTVELSVPIELGNEYANRIGEIDWVFVAEEVNDPKPAPDDSGEPGSLEESVPESVPVQNMAIQQAVQPTVPVAVPESGALTGASTGDASAVGVWLVIALLAVVAIVGVWLYKNKLSGEKGKK